MKSLAMICWPSGGSAFQTVLLAHGKRFLLSLVVSFSNSSFAISLMEDISCFLWFSMRLKSKLFASQFRTVHFLLPFILVCIYPTPPLRAGCDTGSIFKRSKASLKSEFFFPKTGWLTKVKDPILWGEQIDSFFF